MHLAPLSLFAVHISDGLLAAPWLLGGFVGAGLLALFGAWRIREDEIPRVAVLTAAFFVASSLYIKLPGTSVHLLLNGLLGVVLGRRAALAIPVGLFMQAFLLGHGGYTTIGINSCIQVVPALLVGQLFAGLRCVAWVHRSWFRAILVGVSTLAIALSGVFSVALLWQSPHTASAELDTAQALRVALAPATLLVAAIGAVLAAWLERRLENAPEFPLGLLLGELAVLATVALECVVLIAGGEQNWHTWALVLVVAHLPVAVVEGVVLGFTVGFLARVKPEMLGWQAPEEPVCSANSLS